VINSEYILKRLNFRSHKVDEITNKGVVYNYEFYKNGKIALVYSDVYTPRCLMIYNKTARSLNNISGSRVNHELTFHIIKDDLNKSFAYELKPKKIINGIILYIHPGGLHTDFSPRWDAILMNLCNNGYVIIAPNFHLATGYGKTYYNSNIDQALEDVKGWKKYILKKYNNYPMFCFSISSGNILMERLISQDNEGIRAAVSLFGIPDETSEKCFSIPELFIFGENDPFVDFKERNLVLRREKYFHPLISIISYSDEGHWFRKKSNLQDAVSKIITYFYIN